MNRKNALGAWAFGAALIVAGLGSAGLAEEENGREFSGSYRYSEVSVSGDAATLTLAFRLVNHSGVDVSNATVLLHDWVIHDQHYGSFSAVTLSAGQTVQLSGRFRIPQREYQNWQQGRPPGLTILYADARGNTVRRPIAMSRRPVR
jgi:hypothetical protein